MGERRSDLDEIRRLAADGVTLGFTVVGGCTCWEEGTQKYAFDVGLNSSCGYHLAAALQPNNHRIPWNCPTYWDGCNCTGDNPPAAGEVRNDG